jgi:voltage-gated potassium channel
MTKNRLRTQLAQITFGTETPAGRRYDLALIGLIVVSVLVAMLDSVKAYHSAYGQLFSRMEWLLTIAFTLDYLTRLACADRPWHYAFSFYGIIDLLSVLPTYLGILLPGRQNQHLAAIRLLRVLRIFRVMKLTSYQAELQYLWQALVLSYRRITAFLLFVMIIVVILGSLMYTIEDNEEGFTSIPQSIYWAIVTLTTVGYGDISPQSGLGQAVAALIMILGYSIIVIPTGIIAAAAPRLRTTASPAECPQCRHPSHDADARYCKRCGQAL